jgi:ElaB/YqjD/DUF883 family membrane-anchored ribosome-binding protein
MSERFATQKGQLIDDLKTVVSDVQDLVRASSSDGSEALKQSVTDQLAKAMDRLHRLEDHASAVLTHSARSAQTYVQVHPLQALGLSAALGVLVGLLVRRR